VVAAAASTVSAAAVSAEAAAAAVGCAPALLTRVTLVEVITVTPRLRRAWWGRGGRQHETEQQLSFSRLNA
jgi:hypothetical protein